MNGTAICQRDNSSQIIKKNFKIYLKKKIHSLLTPPSYNYRTSSFKQVVPVSYKYETGTAMNARASEKYLAIACSASKSVEIFWAEIYWGRLFFRAESSLIQSSCRSFIRVIVPYEISKVNCRVETKNLVSMSEEI